MTFELAGIKTGLLICYDVEFPQHVLALAQMGVQLILVPTANPEKFSVVCDTLVPARASENALTIVYANYCGSDNGLSFCGNRRLWVLMQSLLPLPVATRKIFLSPTSILSIKLKNLYYQLSLLISERLLPNDTRYPNNYR